MKRRQCRERKSRRAYRSRYIDLQIALVDPDYGACWSAERHLDLKKTTSKRGSPELGSQEKAQSEMNDREDINVETAEPKRKHRSRSRQTQSCDSTAKLCGTDAECSHVERSTGARTPGPVHKRRAHIGFPAERFAKCSGASRRVSKPHADTCGTEKSAPATSRSNTARRSIAAAARSIVPAHVRRTWNSTPRLEFATSRPLLPLCVSADSCKDPATSKIPHRM